mmetsp:Transcript_2308/g.2616  ORF Transcript_2308/g.2616 Transcript_2308/m.2616 type:complete len:306 (+) Transcript_2308:469-1386(+)|eukprot:CAMPEP_0184048834 /NCGR_PEP_ID=MMETSP0956-20121227/3045_1 /TAXON_ID=627963 /ORGANISM="Aplanochytrium sp, Strain PBS07" /LENGTH=305 /DNA_ID=CAMNT_0026340999 /DNA_START=132 /DNA_END=1049 /DNA_ORIENTATION=+
MACRAAFLLAASLLCFSSCFKSGLACSAEDVEFWKNGGGFFSFSDSILELYTIIGRDPLDAELGTVKVFSDYSSICRSCFTTFAECMANDCKTECGECVGTGIACGGNPGCTPSCVTEPVTAFNGAGCSSCRTDTSNPSTSPLSCVSQAELCLNFNLFSCSDCTRPEEEQDITWLVVGGTAGVVALLGFGYCFYLYRTRLKPLPDPDEGMNEWQRRARKKKKPRGSIDLSTAYVPEAVPVPQPQQPLDSQFEDESLVGHFPMVVPEPKTAAVGTAMTVQAPKPEFKVNRTHYHMPNQLMEDPEGK